MNFTYNASKKYILTEDMNDIENYVGCRIPMFKKMNIKAGRGWTDDDELSTIKWVEFTCVFSNVWKAKGADDIRQLPLEHKEIQFTALKDGKVLKQTILILEKI